MPVTSTRTWPTSSWAWASACARRWRSPGIELQAFDQDVWAERYARLDPALAVEAFRGLRAWNLSLLATLSLEDWLAEGYHPERGFESVDLMVRFLAGHDINHLAQLESILTL